MRKARVQSGRRERKAGKRVGWGNWFDGLN
jgi:hypothetical protein